MQNASGNPHSNHNKGRRVFWLCDAPTEIHRQHALRLSQHGYQAQFFSSLELLGAEMAQRRAPIIIVGDELPGGLVEKAITTIASMPEAQGVRLILSVSKQDPNITLMAASCAYRDLIPVDLDSRRWIERFMHATSRNPISIVPPSPRLTLNQMAAVSIPGRLVWLSEKRMLVEARMRPPVGSSFSLSGKFVEGLGLKRLTISVDECRRRDLIFRFSDAVVARWSIPEQSRDAAKTLLNKMRQSDFGPRVKVFLAVQDIGIRTQLIRELDPLRFEVNVALQKQSIVDEPRFFCPQVVFIEDGLILDGDGFKRFQQMLQYLSIETPIIVLGSRIPLKTLQEIDPLRKMIHLPRVPDHLTEAIFNRYLPGSKRKNPNADADAVHIGADHPFSMVEIHCQARLQQAHPQFVQVALPMDVGNFGLYRIEAPEFRRSIEMAPFVKVYDSYEHKQRHENVNFRQVIECYFSDVDTAHQEKLARSLIQSATENFSSVVGTHIVALDSTQTMEIQLAANDSISTPEKSRPEGKIRPRLEEIEVEPVTDLDLKEIGGVFADVAQDGVKVLAELATNKTFRGFLGFVGLTIGALYLIYYLATSVSWDHSGSVYTDQLKKFSPKRFEEGQ